MRMIRLCLFALGLLATSAYADALSVAPLPAPKSPSHGRVKVIAQLSKRTAAIRKEAQECAKPDPKQAEFNSQPKILLDTPTLYSLEVIGDDACPGTAHPSSWQYGLTYDMTTGQRYNLLKLYALGIPDKYGIIKLSPGAAKRVKAELIRADDPECRADIDQMLSDTNMSFGLGPKGLNIYFDAPHAVQACFAPVTLPYAQIHPFLNVREATRLHWRY